MSGLTWAWPCINRYMLCMKQQCSAFTLRTLSTSILLYIVICHPAHRFKAILCHYCRIKPIRRRRRGPPMLVFFARDVMNLQLFLSGLMQFRADKCDDSLKCRFQKLHMYNIVWYVYTFHLSSITSGYLKNRHKFIGNPKFSKLYLSFNFLFLAIVFV